MTVKNEDGTFVYKLKGNRVFCNDKVYCNVRDKFDFITAVQTEGYSFDLIHKDQAHGAYEHNSNSYDLVHKSNKIQCRWRGGRVDLEVSSGCPDWQIAVMLLEDHRKKVKAQEEENERLDSAGIYRGQLHKLCSTLFTPLESFQTMLDENPSWVNKMFEHKLPIHIAASCQPSAVLELFVDKGADINAPDSNGATALVFACEGMAPKNIKWLKYHGAKYGGKYPSPVFAAMRKPIR